jgi:hypothetical protein
VREEREKGRASPGSEFIGGGGGGTVRSELAGDSRMSACSGGHGCWGSGVNDMGESQVTHEPLFGRSGTESVDGVVSGCEGGELCTELSCLRNE